MYYSKQIQFLYEITRPPGSEVLSLAPSVDISTPAGDYTPVSPAVLLGLTTMRLPPTPRLPSNMTWNLCTVLTLALLNVFLAQLADSNMMEGDMAVPSVQGRLDNVSHSFVIAEDRLWAEGLVPFRFEKLKLVGGGFEDLFRDEDRALIRSVLDEITEAVPCVIFR